MDNPAMKDRMTGLESRKQEIESHLAMAASSPSSLRLHPKLAEVYRDKVAHLEEALYEPATKTEAMAIIRGLVDKIVLTPFDDGMKAELHGDLARILAFSDDAEKDQLPGSGEPGSQLSVVAGARNQLYLLITATRLSPLFPQMRA